MVEVVRAIKTPWRCLYARFRGHTDFSLKSILGFRALEGGQIYTKTGSQRFRLKETKTGLTLNLLGF